MSNNSLDCLRIGALPGEYWQALMGNGGEVPGLVNLDLCRRAGRVGPDAPPKLDPNVVCVNPCVAGDTMVLTEVGHVPIALLAAGIEAWPSRTTQFPRLVNMGGYWWDIKPKSVQLTKRAATTVTVTTKEGYKLRCTLDHKLMSLTSEDAPLSDSDPLASICVDWPKLREASSLKPGDKLVLNRQPPAQALVQGWPGYLHLKGTEKDATGELLMATGYALGHFIGDGVYVVNNADQSAQFRVYLHGERADPVVLEPVKAWIERSLVECLPEPRQFWRESWDTDASTGLCKYLFIQSSAFHTNVCEPLGIHHGNKHVTMDCMATATTFQRGLIAGLFDTDGSACLKTNHVVISQEHRETLELVQQMLLTFGIVSMIGQTHKGDVTRRPCYDLRVRPEHIGRFFDTIPVKNSRKLKLLQDIYVQRCSEDNDKVASPTTFQDNALHRVTIESVEVNTQPEDVYDMTIKGLHLMPANGLVVANCGK